MWLRVLGRGLSALAARKGHLGELLQTQMQGPFLQTNYIGTSEGAAWALAFYNGLM